MTETKNNHFGSAESEKKAEQRKKSEPGKKLAVILVRGMNKTDYQTKETLAMLNLQRKNHLVIVNDSASVMGMVKKVKDFVTWGEIDDTTFKELVMKRGEEFLARTADSKGKYEYNYVDFNGRKYKPYFRLNPPKKGFGRKGIKVPFKVGGALGYRGDKINDLIQRMI